jgi:hypothetical protein
MAEEQPAAPAPESAPEQAPDQPGLDIDAAVGEIAESLSLTEPEAEPAAKEPAAPSAPGEPAAEPPATPDAATTKVAGEIPPDGPPPDTWRPAAKEAWAAVPPVIREEMKKRESDIARYVESVKVPLGVSERLSQIVAPYLEDHQRQGLNIWDTIGSMLKAAEMLSKGPPEVKLAMVQSIAQQAGVKLEDGQLTAQPDATQQYVKQLEQRLNQLEGGVRNVTSTMQQARFHELEEGVLKFAQDVEAHPYFEMVADGISHFIQTGAAHNLDEAYNLAVMAHPTARQQFLDAQTAAALKQRDSAEAERVAKAKKASRVNVRSTARGKAEQPLGDIDSTLRTTLADIQSRH